MILGILNGLEGVKMLEKKSVDSIRPLKSIYFNIFKSLFIAYIFFILYMLTYTGILLTSIYFIYASFILFLVFITIKYINSIFINTTMFLWFIGYVLSVPIMYANIELYDVTGWRAVGLFDFSSSEIIQIFFIISLYFIFYLLSALILDRLIISKYYLTRKENHKMVLVKNNSLKIIIFSLIVMLQFPLSTFMFQHKVGIVGVIPENLPYHLAGILYYYRLFIYPIISFLLVYFTLEKKYSLIIVLFIFLEVFYSGIMSVSRSLLIIHIIPVIYYFYVKRNNIFLFFTILLTLLMFALVSLSRNYVFLLNSFSNINIANILSSLSDEQNRIMEVFTSSIFSIIGRIGGIGEFIPVYFNTHHIDFFSNSYMFGKVLGISYFQNNFDEVGLFYGITLPDDKAYGIALDIFSQVYLSSQTLVGSFFIIFCFVLLGILSEKILNIILYNKISKNNFILLMTAIIVYAVPNDHVRIFYFKQVYILFIIYLSFNALILKKYRYKVKSL